MSKVLTVDSMIDRLAEKMSDGRVDQLDEVHKMEKRFKNATLRKNLNEHPAMAELLSMIKKREASFTLLLSNKEDATDLERAHWFARRKEARFVLRFFESADRAIEGIEKELVYQLSDTVDNQYKGGAG